VGIDAVAFLSGEGILWRFLDAFALPAAPWGQEIVEDVPDGLAACPGGARRCDAGLAAGVVAGDADGHGEGDPVRVDPGGAGRFGPERAQCLVDGEEREEFLVDQFGRSGAQDERCPAEPGLEFAVAGLDDPAFYGDRWAAVYDDHHGQMDPGPAVEFLVGLAGDGRVLELAIGTGRVALPLAARGITVEGVDASAALMERLRAKPGGDSIPVTMGDMAQVPVSGRFRPATATSLFISEPDQLR